MGVLDGLGTDKVFYYFEEITKIPHGSGNEDALADYIVNFAKERGLYCRKDEAGNVVVKKPAAKGYENVKPVILQGHIDMVCEKLADIEHDFTKDPLELVIDGDFICAKGTTLGADNGIAAAYMLAVLDKADMLHPAMEMVFTVEEETGMDGAKKLDTSDLEGKYFINMDSEEEGKFLISCCGGRRVHVLLPVERIAKKADGLTYLLKIRGLKGGHSGSDIHLQRASANKLIGRVLYELEKSIPFALVSVDGGKMDNAICREADAVLTITKEDAEKAEKIVKAMEKMLQEEYHHTETDMMITWEKLHEETTKVLTEDWKKRVIAMLLLIPYGVEAMSLDIVGLVESSSNIGVVSTKQDGIHFDNAIRSAVASKKEMICEKIAALAEICGGKTMENNDYPGWVYDVNSKLMKVLQQSYRQATGKEPELTAIHAGVECGLFAEKMEGLDMVSLGPDMYDVHTPKERLSISSTIRMWDFLKEALREMENI